uniref:Frizzled-4 n=1 Tax=Ditylenchus dipsaci TaxID=166011 RepID=A0A915DXR0_9BILA
MAGRGDCTSQQQQLLAFGKIFYHAQLFASLIYWYPITFLVILSQAMMVSTNDRNNNNDVVDHHRTIRRSSQANKCEKITATHCLDIGYNLTRFPNFAGDDSSVSALEDFATFEPLISVKCSEQLKFFLCSVYFPMCTEKVSVAIGPCRPLCQQVQDSCINVLKEFGFSWPASLNCSKFPTANNENVMCMGGAMSEQEPQEYQPKESEHAGITPKKPGAVVDLPYFSLGAQRDINYAEELKKYVLPGYKCVLPAAMVYINRTAQCVPYCNSSRGYSPGDLNSANSALIIGSILSAALTCFCLLMVLLRSKTASSRNAEMLKKSRQNSGGASKTCLQLPAEKSLQFCALSFACSALIYLMCLFQKDKIGCMHYSGHNLFLVAGMQHVPCTLAATLIYYFGSAGRIWWIALCFSWRFSMTQHSKLDIKKFIFRAHCLCWSIPLALCILALMAQAIQADPLSGVCIVGGSNRLQHQIFLSGRDALTLVASFLIIASGCLTSTSDTQRPPKPSDPNASSSNTGILLISLIYPLVCAFWLVASLHYLFLTSDFNQHHHQQPKRNHYQGGWDIIAARKLLADSSLGICLGAAFFIHMVYSCWSHLNEVQLEQPVPPTVNIQPPMAAPKPVIKAPSSNMASNIHVGGGQVYAAASGTIGSYRLTTRQTGAKAGYQPMSQVKGGLQPMSQVKGGLQPMSQSMDSTQTGHSSMPLPPPPPPLSALPVIGARL